ncbi:hypothetical protein HDU92_000228, partial [Lobulomyces angularis]
MSSAEEKNKMEVVVPTFEYSLEEEVEEKIEKEFINEKKLEFKILDVKDLQTFLLSQEFEVKKEDVNIEDENLIQQKNELKKTNSEENET